MEVDLYSNSVVICIVCSDAVIIRYANKHVARPDFEGMYLLRVTTCYRCKRKIVSANVVRRTAVVNTISADIHSDDDIVMDMDTSASMDENIPAPMNERVYDGYNTPISPLAIAGLPMYKRLSAYLKGKMNARTLNGFCVIESLSMVMPDFKFEFSIMSVIVGVHSEKKQASCGCLHDYTKEDITEIAYEDTTFFDQMRW